MKALKKHNLNRFDIYKHTVMTEQSITYETAKMAKAAGCNLQYCRCGGYPDCICGEDLILISQSLLQKWLRDRDENHHHRYHIQIDVDYGGYTWLLHNLTSECCVGEGDTFETYEEALEAGLQEALKMIL